jgi:hypothetical protein
VGTYTLSESGPPGYTAGGWSCQGANVTGGNSIVLAEGESATCTILNTAVPGVWELTKLADPPSGTPVDPGATITYTLVAAHESGSPVTGAKATDDLRNVLPYATIGSLPAGLTLVDTTLTWEIPTIPVGGSVQVSFRVTVLDGAGGNTVHNLAAPASPGGHCSPCEATHAVRVVPIEPSRPIPRAGLDVWGPVRWAALLVLTGALLIVGVHQLRRRRQRLI